MGWTCAGMKVMKVSFERDYSRSVCTNLGLSWSPLGEVRLHNGKSVKRLQHLTYHRRLWRCPSARDHLGPRRENALLTPNCVGVSVNDWNGEPSGKECQRQYLYKPRPHACQELLPRNERALGEAYKDVSIRWWYRPEVYPCLCCPQRAVFVAALLRRNSLIAVPSGLARRKLYCARRRIRRVSLISWYTWVRTTLQTVIQ